MLILHRKPGQGIALFPNRDLPITAPLLSIEWPLTITVLNLARAGASLGFKADHQMVVLRSELEVNDASAGTGPNVCDQALLSALRFAEHALIFARHAANRGVPTKCLAHINEAMNFLREADSRATGTR